MNAPDIETILRARAAFDASLERLDADTRHRLREARRQALAPPRATASGRWAWTTGAALAAALGVVVMWPQAPSVQVRGAGTAAATASTPATQRRPATLTPTATVAAVTAPSIIADSSRHDGLDAATVDAADPAMLDDLDFYGWLAQQSDASQGGG